VTWGLVPVMLAIFPVRAGCALSTPVNAANSPKADIPRLMSVITTLKKVLFATSKSPPSIPLRWRNPCV
jgi:hypothetical protein